MRYSSLSRNNMRYRGPMESAKLNKFRTDTEVDLRYLYEKIEEIKKETKAMREEFYAGGMEMSSKYGFVRLRAAYLKGGDSRE